VLLLCLLQAQSLPAQEIATLTVVEGPLRVIRGTTVLRGAEGVKLHAGDILESSSAGFVQLEFVAGTVVALGPSTRLFLFRTEGKRGDAPSELVVLSGWLKGETSANAGAYCYASPVLAATTRGGTVVLHTSSAAAELFVESGPASIEQVSSDGHVAAPVEAKAGQFFSRRAGKGIALNPRPDSAFVDSMPRPFRDTLPSRLARFPKGTEPKRDHEVSYSEVQPWLTMAPTWRKGFVDRFQPRLKDAAFRKALEAHVKDYPEWEPVLHPEDQHLQTSPAAPDDSAPARRR